MLTSRLARLLVLAVLLGAPPLLAAWISGEPLAPLLRFPPTPPSVAPAPFSWPYFALLSVLLVAIVGPVVAHVVAAGRRLRPAPGETHRFPSWGWAGLVLMALAWTLAWSRFPWFAPLQTHTFAPLWLGYIVVVNAWTTQRTGRCMLTHRTRRFLLLFPLSALLWWCFEYLNRFAGNWYYVGIGDFGPWEYCIFASVSFSTVLPAVLGTREWLASFPRLSAGLEHFAPIALPAPRLLAAALLTAGVAGVAGLALWPQWLFPLVWIAPLLVVLALQILAGEDNALSRLAYGDWRPLWLPAVAALVCGLFWEMWNYGSLAHWEYAIPFTQRFHLFEMPLLGYAGYLPFGITCAAVVDLFFPKAVSDTTWYLTPVNGPAASGGARSRRRARAGG